LDAFVRRALGHRAVAFQPAIQSSPASLKCRFERFGIRAHVIRFEDKQSSEDPLRFPRAVLLSQKVTISEECYGVVGVKLERLAIVFRGELRPILVVIEHGQAPVWTAAVRPDEDCLSERSFGGIIGELPPQDVPQVDVCPPVGWVKLDCSPDVILGQVKLILVAVGPTEFTVCQLKVGLTRERPLKESDRVLSRKVESRDSLSELLVAEVFDHGNLHRIAKRRTLSIIGRDAADQV
jgi:hypothetical protein